jgi:hypothetical protein
MKLKKGSPEAKRFMAKIRAKKKPVKKISGIKESNKLKKDLKAKKLRLTHGYTTVKRKLSGVIKNKSLGASGDYAKFEIAVIKNLAKLLKKTYKKVQEIVNTDESLLNIISKNFDKKISVSITAKELKAKLIVVAKKNPLDSFIEILNKLPKKDQVSRSVKFPIKLPATVQIGSNKKNKNSVLSGLIKLSVDEKKFLENEGKKSKGFKYRGKMLWGEWIVLKEKENGQPVQKFIVDSYEIADYLSKQLNKGQKLTKIKGTKIK